MKQYLHMCIKHVVRLIIPMSLFSGKGCKETVPTENSENWKFPRRRDNRSHKRRTSEDKRKDAGLLSP